MAILRTADLVRRRIGAIAATRGLTLHQYNVLRILRGARPTALSRAQVGERTLETVTDLTELLGELAARALVRCERGHAGGEGGPDLYSITVAGAELLAQLDEPVAAADRASMGGLGSEEARALIALLGRVRDGP